MRLKRMRLLHHVFLTFTLFFLMSASAFPFLRVSSLQNDSYHIISSNGMVDYPLPPEPPPSERLFWSAGSYWRQKIPKNAPLHPNSAQMANWLVTKMSRNGPTLSYRDWSEPVWDAYKDTPKVNVYRRDKTTVRMYNVPIAPGWKPSEDGDHMMTIIDWDNWEFYEFWRIYYEEDIWWADAGYKWDLNSSGVLPIGQWAIGSASCPYMAIRDEEIAAGVINHPLVCKLGWPKRNYHVWPPAARTHGQSYDTYSVPDGARIQLNPELDLDSLGLTRSQKIIAKCLQEWGMVVKEEAAEGYWGIYCEHEFSVDGGWSQWGFSAGMMNLAEFRDQWRIVDYSVFSNEGVVGALYYMEY